jgi:outer membrane lipoprotein SlyB
MEFSGGVDRIAKPVVSPSQGLPAPGVTPSSDMPISRPHNKREGRFLVRNVIGGVAVAMLWGLSGCGPSYSPNTYASAAVQQAAKVDQGEVVGVRQVSVSADATLGTVTGAAAGGIAGAGVDAGGPVTALSALGGSVVGGLVGSGVEHATGDTIAYEYIVRQNNGDLVSVTQRDTVPLAIGQKVLVISGKQARVVADYTVSLPGFPPPPAKGKAAGPDKPAPAPGPVDMPSAAAATAASPVVAGPPAASTAVPAVSAPVAAAIDGSRSGAAASVPVVVATPSGTAAPAASPTAVGPAQVGPAQVGPAQVGPAQAGPAQAGAPVSLALPVAPAAPSTPAAPTAAGDAASPAAATDTAKP